MFDIDKKAFGTFVAARRKEKGYTQKELAEKLFLSDKAISKWETGASLPDTAMLIPLSELLGVSVTELLLCRRMEPEAVMDSAQVEDMVKTALVFSEEHPTRAYQTRSIFQLLYLLSLPVGCAILLLSHSLQALYSEALTAALLGAIFGVYFCFLTKTKLPTFYDENRCGFYVDGPFRLNIPGIAITNANWAHIVRVGCFWSCISMTLFPALSLVMTLAYPALWMRIRLFVTLALLLGGLFIPMYIAGKAHE